MAEQLAEVEAIAADPEPPTFENTLVALERSGRLLRPGRGGVLQPGRLPTPTPGMQRIEAELAPRLAAHADAIYLDRALFARIEALLRARATRSAWTRSRGGCWSATTPTSSAPGAELDDGRAGAAARAQRRAVDARDGVRAEPARRHQRAAPSWWTTRRELDGLSADAVAAAAEAARDRGLDGRYVHRAWCCPPQQPRARRAAPTGRCASAPPRLGRPRRRGDARHRRAGAAHRARCAPSGPRLLGYANHAAYVVADQTAPAPRGGRRDARPSSSPAAVANARRGGRRRSDAIGRRPSRAVGLGVLRRAGRARRRYDVDAAALRPVLRAGAGAARRRLLRRRPAVRPALRRAATTCPATTPTCGSSRCSTPTATAARPVPRRLLRPAVQARRGVDEQPRHQSRLLGTRPVVVNNLNIAKPPAGRADAARPSTRSTRCSTSSGTRCTALFSDVRYPRFSGTAVPRDFVEYPSQVNEMWATWPEVLRQLRPAPRDRRADAAASWSSGCSAARRFNQGFATVEYLAAALLDWAWHTLDVDERPGRVADVEAFEARGAARGGRGAARASRRGTAAPTSPTSSAAATARATTPTSGARCSTPTPSSGSRRTAGCARENGDRFRRELLSRGGSVDAMEAFRAFRGRDPRIEPLLDRRGLL